MDKAPVFQLPKWSGLCLSHLAELSTHREFHMAALSLVPRGDFPCLSRQLDSMQAKKGPGGPFAVLASPFIAEPALPE